MSDVRDEAIEELREELRESEDRDRLMIKAVSQLDQLNNNINQQMERFRDWYSLHFPELEEEIGDDEQFVKVLSRGVKREDLDSFGSLAEGSTGSEIAGPDVEILESQVELLEKMFEQRDELEGYVEKVAKEEMSNLSTLLGPLLAARIVGLAGGLEEIAKKPASTVQMLGAEKALFRYLRGEGTPPKHGILFQHSFVNSLDSDRRGKMARFLANKAVMAARLDQYGDKEKGEELREEARQKYESLKD
ncbi:MAG: hypothetical protein ABEK01_03530 [Candidatus Nanohaloarchaea archaeon]